MVSTTGEMAVPSLPQQQQQQQPSAKPKVKKSAASGHSNASGGPSAKGKNAVDRRAPDPLELQMARQDLFRVANPDTNSPFRSLEDACDRLLPYHVLAEFDLEETEKGGEILSKNQAWEESLKKRTEEFMATLEKQVNLYNSIMKKQSDGEMRGEERMMVEQSLLVEEKQKLATLRAQIEAKEKEEREAAEAKAKEAIVQAERARAEAQAQAQAQARAEAAQAEAESKAEALRAEADSLAKTESHAKVEGDSNAGLAPEPMNITGVIENDVDWAEQEEEDDNGEEDEEDDEGAWDEDGEDEEDDDEDPDSQGDTEMGTDYETAPFTQDRVSKPS